MMPQKFINICVLQSFLLLANKLIFLFLISTNVYADWTKAEGRYFISRNISKGEACDRALMLAKRNALSKNGFQKFKSDQLDICTEIKDKNIIIIMAGGKGSRLGAYTKNCPKPLLKIGSKPILEHIINYYKSFGFKDFIIASGYKHLVIKLFIH